VWPNTFTWTWDESSQVKSSVTEAAYLLKCLFLTIPEAFLFRAVCIYAFVRGHTL